MKSGSRKNSIQRIKGVSFLFIFISGVVIFRLFGLQVLNAQFYRDEARSQYIAPASQDIFERGNIFFSRRDGQLISGATTTTGFKIAIKPDQIENPEELFLSLGEIINLDKEDFFMRANKKNDPYEEIAKRLSKEEADKIRGLNAPGVFVFQEKWRFYPGGRLSAKTLGFVAYDGDDLSGRYGLERVYNDILSRGKDEVYVNFFAEIFSNITETVFSSDKNNGDIVTTIEPMVSQSLEKELNAIMNKWSSNSAGGIVINPKNGEIYAMSHLPDFDLNNFSEENESRIFSNPLVESVFEFGSVIKPIVIASALDAGVIDSNTKYYDAGKIIVEDKEIKNFDGKGRGQVNVDEILGESLNTGMVYISSLLGKENMKKYLLSFGLGEKTGIDLPLETGGLVSNLNSPRMLEYANASFGQGIALSPISAVSAFSVLANNGSSISPHLIKEIIYEDGSSKETEIKNGDMVIKKESAEEITRMLVKNIDEFYFNGGKKIENYSVAGKTGTAQIARKDGKGYEEGKNLHSFFGYFPAYDPEFLVLLFTEDPKNVKFASETLIDPFFNLAKFLIHYYEVSPDR